MTIQRLIKGLKQWNDPDAIVKAFDPDSEKEEEVSGTLYDPVKHTVVIYTDDIS